MANATKVGGDIDSWCTRCKMTLGHTILAMVGSRPARVRCNTCQGEHNYRGAAAVASRKSGWEPREERERREARPAVTSWDALLAGKDLTRARKYSAKDKFTADEVIQHPTFGIGLVQEVRGDKIQVAFKADVKTLVHGK
ncbi:MAG TPA: hypothetical protein VFE90_06585 [Myxococcales bacterium]|jgi:hypothetical protein|nr:hypothetical protein [Myxococcales bacterium]